MILRGYLLIMIIYILTYPCILSQYNKDYLDASQYKKYSQRRQLLANWKINQLADSGALIVRLKSNRKAIDLLKKNKNYSSAKELEQFTQYQNKIIMKAFIHHYKFSKYYFIYDYSSDSLLKGTHKGIFLDTNLNRDSYIEMKEKFYLIAEKDYIIQSSIGLVPDSLAQKITDKGTPVKEVSILIKNKYGHQLKPPFPYYIKGTNPKKYNDYVISLNTAFKKFREKNPRKNYPVELSAYMY